MRVLVLTNMYPTATEPWFGCFVKDQVEDLRALDVDVEVLSVDARASRARYATAARDLHGLLRQGSFDLVHAHYGLTGAVALAQRRVPVVTTFHGGDYTGEIPWHTPVSRIVSGRSTPIVVSAEGRRRLRRPAAAVIPMPVDTERFRPVDRHDARAELGWQQERTYALFPSNPAHANKRVHLFEAALDEVRSRGTDVEPVYLKGFDRDAVALVMNAVDVTVLTSKFEGSPVTVRESLASCTPVVSVAVGDVVEAIGGLPKCAVAAAEARALADAIAAALGPERSPELRERALSSSRSRVGERVLEVYENVLQDQPKPS
jgi:glycosyltransferase involved in cell wall biosynthesis